MNRIRETISRASSVGAVVYMVNAAGGKFREPK